MPIVNTGEESQTMQSGKPQKFKNGKNTFTVDSNLYHYIFHYIEEQKMSVICKGREGDCEICKVTVKEKDDKGNVKIVKKYKTKAVRAYYGTLNGVECVFKIPFGVFEYMVTLEQENEIDKRSKVWDVIRTGDGIGTRYTTMLKGDRPKGEYTQAKNDEANKKMIAFMLPDEKICIDNYDLFKASLEAENSPEYLEDLEISDENEPTEKA